VRREGEKKKGSDKGGPEGRCSRYVPEKTPHEVELFAAPRKSPVPSSRGEGNTEKRSRSARVRVPSRKPRESLFDVAPGWAWQGKKGKKRGESIAWLLTSAAATCRTPRFLGGDPPSDGSVSLFNRSAQAPAPASKKKKKKGKKALAARNERGIVQADPSTAAPGCEEKAEQGPVANACARTPAI